MKRILGLVTASVLLIAIIASFVYRQSIYDWYLLRDYMPSAEVVEIANATTMTDEAKKIFYINHPQIANKKEFNNHCRNNEQSIVLGCYQSFQRGIFLFDVTDDRLSGIKEVTAAHEMLHAAYDRLSFKEKEKVNELLEANFKHIDNQRVIESIERYRKQDPHIVLNEMHSIFGSEVRNLSSELETYYRRYFKDRSAVVQLSEQYEQVFIDRRNTIRDYDSKLSDLKKEIEKLSEDLKVSSVEINQQRQELNELRKADVQEYNNKVTPYNRLVENYNKEVTELESLVNKYNDIVQKRNSIASEEAELVQAIDSRKIVPSQQ